MKLAKRLSDAATDIAFIRWDRSRVYSSVTL